MLSVALYLFRYPAVKWNLTVTNYSPNPAKSKLSYTFNTLIIDQG